VTLALVVLLEGLLVEAGTGGHAHADKFDVGCMGADGQEDLLVVGHLLQKEAYLLKAMARHQPLHMVVDNPLLAAVHRGMDEMKQLFAGLLENLIDGPDHIRPPALSLQIRAELVPTAERLFRAIELDVTPQLGTKHLLKRSNLSRVYLVKLTVGIGGFFGHLVGVGAG